MNMGPSTNNLHSKKVGGDSGPTLVRNNDVAVESQSNRARVSAERGRRARMRGGGCAGASVGLRRPES